MRLISRISSGVLGAALLVFGLWLSLISVIVGIVPQSPNPYVMDGDPCCGVPDTWAETREMAFGGWLWLGLGLAVFITGTMLIAGAARGRRLQWRWLPISVVAVMVIAGTAIVVAYLRLDELPQMTRCREAGEQMKRYPSTSGTEREELSGLIRDCDLLAGLPQPEVRTALGSPSRKTYRDDPATETWHYPDQLTVRFGKRRLALPD